MSLKVVAVVSGISALYWVARKQQGAISFADIPAPVKWDRDWDRLSLRSVLLSRPDGRKRMDEIEKCGQWKEQEEAYEERNSTPDREILLLVAGQMDYVRSASGRRDLLERTPLTRKQNLRQVMFVDEHTDLHMGKVYMPPSELNRFKGSYACFGEVAEWVSEPEVSELLKPVVPFVAVPPVPHHTPYWRRQKVTCVSDPYKDGALAEAAFRHFVYRPRASGKKPPPRHPSEDLPTEEEMMALKPEVTVLIGTAPTLAYILCRALQLPPERWGLFKLHHGSVTRLQVSSRGKVVAVGVGECSFQHVQPECNLNHLSYS